LETEEEKQAKSKMHEAFSCLLDVVFAAAAAAAKIEHIFFLKELNLIQQLKFD
jgi:hypothetical protein